MPEVVGRGSSRSSLQGSGEASVVSGVFLDVDYVGRDREREWGEVRGAHV